MLSVLLATAFADTPAAVDEMIIDANAAIVGSDPVDAVGAPSRLTAVQITAQMQRILDRLAATGCTDGVVQGFGAGSFTGGTATGTSDTDGVIDLDYAGGSLSGTFDGLVAGDIVSTVKSGKFVVDVDDSGSFFAGHHIRVQGAQRVFFGMHGTCDLGGSAEDALRLWFAGDVTGLDTSTSFPAEEPMSGVDLRTTYGPGDVTFAKRVFGSSVTLLDDTLRPIVADEVLAVCPGFEQSTKCGISASIFDVTTPAVILGQDVNVGCAVWSAGDPVTLILDGGSWTTSGFGLFDDIEPILHASASTMLEVGDTPSQTTTHPNVDFDGLFDGCSVVD